MNLFLGYSSAVDTFLNFALVFLTGAIAGVLAMLAVEAYQERVEDAEDY